MSGVTVAVSRDGGESVKRLIPIAHGHALYEEKAERGKPGLLVTLDHQTGCGGIHNLFVSASTQELHETERDHFFMAGKQVIPGQEASGESKGIKVTVTHYSIEKE